MAAAGCFKEGTKQPNNATKAGLKGAPGRCPIARLGVVQLLAWALSNCAPSGMPMVVIHDSKSKYITAEIVPEKGLSEYAVRRLAQIVNRLGYRRVVIKSDQEASIVALKGAVKRESLN
jgi:hypothetical protein